MREVRLATVSDLDPPTRRWILINAVIAGALINLVLNALIAWGRASEVDEIPLWEESGLSTIGDTLGTLVVLPLITTLLIAAGVRREIAHGKLSALERYGGLAEAARRLPDNMLLRGLVFGLACLVILGPPMAGLLALVDFDDPSTGTFVAYKAIFGVALGLLVAPFIALDAMARPRKAP